MPSMWRLLLGWLKLKLSMVTLTGLGFLSPAQLERKQVVKLHKDFLA